MTPDELLDRLRRMHDWMRDGVVAACEARAAEDLAEVAEPGDQAGGDVTFALDRVSEAAMIEWLRREVAADEPIVLIAEGLRGGRVTLPEGTPESAARWRIIVDPIDGTRGLAYQKRSAWILTGVAPNRGAGTTLADIDRAVQTEIPLIKQHLADQVWATRGRGTKGVRVNRFTGESRPLAIRPSGAPDLVNGFATVCRFFPGGRAVLAAVDDALADRLTGPRTPGGAALFEDQYASTGGQLFGLANGQDRFVADLRPLVGAMLRARGEAAGLCCHPYDLATKLIAEEAGVVIVDPGGQPIDVRLDTTADVAWVGYANANLHRLIQPALTEVLRAHGLTPSR